jgi:hypothetical protein
MRHSEERTIQITRNVPNSALTNSLNHRQSNKAVPNSYNTCGIRTCIEMEASHTTLVASRPHKRALYCVEDFCRVDTAIQEVASCRKIMMQ